MKRFPIWTLIILLIGLLTLSACKPTEIQQPFASYTVVIDATIPYFPLWMKPVATLQVMRST
jgi:hypothetical protein